MNFITIVVIFAAAVIVISCIPETIKRVWKKIKSAKASKI